MIGGVRIRSAAVSLWISSALVSGCTAAHAEESGDHLQVEVIGCGNLLSPAALEEALGVELRGAEAQVSGYIQRARPRVRARCAAGEIIVEVIADDGVALQESVHTRRLGLPRFVAIAVAESVAARAAVLPAPLPIAPPPAPATPPPPLPLAPRKPPRLVASVWAGGAALYGGTPGWWNGAAELGADLTLPLNVRGPFSDGDDGRLPAAIDTSTDGAFRTPMLRCANRRLSFMHNGQVPNLAGAVAYFDRGGEADGYPGTRELAPLHLTSTERADLVAFIAALDGPGPAPNLLAPLP